MTLHKNFFLYYINDESKIFGRSFDVYFIQRTHSATYYPSHISKSHLIYTTNIINKYCMCVLNKHYKCTLVQNNVFIIWNFIFYIYMHKCMTKYTLKNYGHSEHSCYYLILSIFSVHFLCCHFRCHQQPDLSCGHSGSFSVWGPQGSRPDCGRGPPRGNHRVFHTTRKCCREVIISLSLAFLEFL